MKKFDTINTFESFLKSINETSTVALYHDSDCDGTTAATLIIKGLKRVKDKDISYVFTHQGKRAFTPEIIKDLQNRGVTHLIVADLSMENDPLIDEILSFAKVLVIDHHPTTVDGNKEGLTVIKSQDLHPEQEMSAVCTAQMAYELFSALTDMSDLDWLAAAGILADANFEHQREFVEGVFKKYSIDFRTPDPFNTYFAKVPKYIDFARCADLNNIERIRSVLLEAKSFEDAIENLKEFEPIAQEVTRAVNEYDVKKEDQGILSFYHLVSPYEINSLCSTIISFQKDPDHLIIVYKEKDGETHVSARFQKKTIDTGKLLRACIQGFENANAGGHIPASGAGFPSKYWSEFKKRLIEQVDNEEFKV